MIQEYKALWDPLLALGAWMHVHVRDKIHHSSHVKRYLPVDTLTMNLLSAWLSTEVPPWIPDTGTHCHFAVIPPLQNEDFSWENVAQQPSVMMLRDRKWSRQHSGVMRLVEWLPQSNDGNNWDYTPQPLCSSLSLFDLTSHLHSITLASQHLIFQERCMKWEIPTSLCSQS